MMTLSQFFAVLRGRWKLALFVFVAVVLAALAVSFMTTKKYTATASVVVDIKPDPLSSLLGGGGGGAQMSTQVDILQSDRVTRAVIRELKLDQNPTLKEAWASATGSAGSMEDWLVPVLGNALTVLPSRESNVLFVSYQAPDPQFASIMANTYVKAYMKTVLDLRVDPARQYNEFFEQRGLDARQTLEAAQAKLSAFQRENGVVASDERIDVETLRLNELNSQLVTLQGVAADSQTREAQARRGRVEELNEALSNPLLSQLKMEIGRAEVNLQQLNTRLGSNHPQVQQAQAQITELKSRLASETARVAGSVNLTASINSTRVADVRAQMEQQRNKLLALKQTRDTMALLQRDVDNAQRTYDALSGRQTQTALESQTQQSNVNLLSSAVPPLFPSSPKLTINAAVGVLGGLFLAGLVTLVVELQNRLVRGTGDVVEVLGLPVLGVLPAPRKPARRVRARIQRMISGRALAAPKA